MGRFFTTTPTETQSTFVDLPIETMYAKAQGLQDTYDKTAALTAQELVEPLAPFHVDRGPEAIKKYNDEIKTLADEVRSNPGNAGLIAQKFINLKTRYENDPAIRNIRTGREIYEKDLLQKESSPEFAGMYTNWYDPKTQQYKQIDPATKQPGFFSIPNKVNQYVNDQILTKLKDQTITLSDGRTTGVKYDPGSGQYYYKDSDTNTYTFLDPAMLNNPNAPEEVRALAQYTNTAITDMASRVISKNDEQSKRIIEYDMPLAGYDPDNITQEDVAEYLTTFISPAFYRTQTTQPGDITKLGDGTNGGNTNKNKTDEFVDVSLITEPVPGEILTEDGYLTTSTLALQNNKQADEYNKEVVAIGADLVTSITPGFLETLKSKYPLFANIQNLIPKDAYGEPTMSEMEFIASSPSLKHIEDIIVNEAIRINDEIQNGTLKATPEQYKQASGVAMRFTQNKTEEDYLRTQANIYDLASKQSLAKINERYEMKDIPDTIDIWGEKLNLRGDSYNDKIASVDISDKKESIINAFGDKTDYIKAMSDYKASGYDKSVIDPNAINKLKDIVGDDKHFDKFLQKLADKTITSVKNITDKYQIKSDLNVIHVSPPPGVADTKYTKLMGDAKNLLSTTAIDSLSGAYGLTNNLDGLLDNATTKSKKFKKDMLKNGNLSSVQLVTNDTTSASYYLTFTDPTSKETASFVLPINSNSSGIIDEISLELIADNGASERDLGARMYAQYHLPPLENAKLLTLMKTSVTPDAPLSYDINVPTPDGGNQVYTVEKTAGGKNLPDIYTLITENGERYPIDNIGSIYSLLGGVIVHNNINYVKDAQSLGGSSQGKPQVGVKQR